MVWGRMEWRDFPAAVAGLVNQLPLLAGLGS